MYIVGRLPDKLDIVGRLPTMPLDVAAVKICAKCAITNPRPHRRDCLCIDP